MTLVKNWNIIVKGLQKYQGVIDVTDSTPHYTKYYED